MLVNNINSKRNRLFENLIGELNAFTLESRIFNGISLLCTLVLFINSALKFTMGQHLIGLMALLCASLSFCEYYLSRVQNKLNIALLLFGLVAYALFPLMYLNDAAIDGPSLYALMAILFLLMIIAPKKQYALWMLLNFAMVTGLLMLTYYHPELVKSAHHPTEFRLINIGYNYIFFAFIIGSLTIYLKSVYNHQRELLEQKAHQLHEANETKDKIFSIIAHDLRTPLASLQNYLEILNEVEFSVAEKQRMELELLAKTKNTDQMLSNLLSWTLNQKEGIQAKLITVDLKEVVAPILKLIQATATEKDIIIHNLIPSAIYVMADRDMLQLIVRNLVNNAVKFTSPGGEVNITHEIKDGHCNVMVSDNGVGISPESQTTLFSLKTNPTYGTRNEKGTGLGLMLCKEFIEMQKGTIGFKSKSGQGTTFYFKLRMAA